MKSECTELMAFLLPWQQNSSKGAKQNQMTGTEISEKRKAFVFFHVQVEITAQHFGLHLFFGHWHCSETWGTEMPTPFQPHSSCSSGLALPKETKFCNALPTEHTQQCHTKGSHKFPRDCPCIWTLQQSGQRTQERLKKNLQLQKNY